MMPTDPPVSPLKTPIERSGEPSGHLHTSARAWRACRGAFQAAAHVLWCACRVLLVIAIWVALFAFCWWVTPFFALAYAIWFANDLRDFLTLAVAPDERKELIDGRSP